MEYGPQVMPCTAFGERASPFCRIEVLRSGPVPVSALHESGLWVEDIAVVVYLAAEDVFIVAVPGHFGQLAGAPVIVCIFECFCRGFPDIGVRNVSEGEIFFPSVASARRASRAVIRGFMIVGFKGLFRVECPDAFGPCRRLSFRSFRGWRIRRSRP